MLLVVAKREALRPQEEEIDEFADDPLDAHGAHAHGE
jgi:hypothetical protein